MTAPLPVPSLPAHAFRRADESADGAFYAAPRFVTHIDAAAVAAVTALYRECLPPGGAVLDLMSSWVSHLPGDVAYDRVAGLGMNADELAANARLTERQGQDLNVDPRLPYGDAEFDAATCCVSVQYLVRPLEVFRELAPGRSTRGSWHRTSRRWAGSGSPRSGCTSPAGGARETR
jgi:hypothetical protein